MKQLLYNDPKQEYNNKNLYIKLRIILIGELSTFLSLKTIENYFNPEKPEFSIQLVVENIILDAFKDLLSYRREGYTIKNPLRIKVPELELLSDSFNNSDLFPNIFDSTSITNADNGLTLVTSTFIVSNKVTVQIQFRTYSFNNRSRLIFRLLKLQKL